MKKLVLGSLALAALASQTIGCTSSDGDEFATVSAEWQFLNLNPDSTIDAETDCPIGVTTIELYNQELDDLDRPIGQPIVDLFDCDLGIGVSAPLIPSVYETFIVASNDNSSADYADTVSAFLDVIDVDLTYKTQIINNGGYFQYDWLLKTPGGAPLSCAEAGSDGVELIATLAGSGGAAATDIFDCEKEFAVTAGYHQGDYTFVLEALDGQQSIGSTQPKTALVRDRNQITDLGSIDIVIP